MDFETLFTPCGICNQLFLPSPYQGASTCYYIYCEECINTRKINCIQCKRNILLKDW